MFHIDAGVEKWESLKGSLVKEKVFNMLHPKKKKKNQSNKLKVRR